MSEKITYISLQEAAKLCSYSQDYLSLRARQGKLRARKIGRNWVTTQEWLDDYIQKVETSRNGFSGPPDRGKPEAKLVFPPQNLPVQEAGVVLEREGTFLTFRGAVVTLALLAFVAIGLKSGEQGVLNIYQNGVAAALEAQESGKQVVLGAQDIPENLGELGQSFQRGVKHATASPAEFADAYVNLVVKGTVSAAEQLAGAYAKADQALSQGIRSDLSSIASGYQKFNSNVDSLFTTGLGFFSKGEPIAKEESGEQGVPGELVETERGGETSGPVVVQPVREVVREVLDSSALDALRAQVGDLLTLQGDFENLRILTERIQAHPPTIINDTAPVYIGSSGIQVGGNGNFATLGVTGPAGIQSLGVGTSASFGSNSSDTFIVKGTATFISPVIVSSATTLSSLTVQGATTLGDEAIDTVTFNASTLSIPNDLNIDNATLFVDSANNRVGLGATTPDQLLVLNDGSLAFSAGGNASDVVLSRGSADRLDLAVGDSLRIIGGQLQLDLDDTGASQGIVFGSVADVNLYRSSANTLATSSKLLVGTAGLALDIQNTTDSSSNQIAAFRGGVRSTPANNDTGYLSFTLDDGSGTQNELARLSFSILDVATSSKDGVLTLSSKVSNTLTDTLYVRGGNVGIGVSNPANALTVGGGDILSMGDEFGSSGIEFHNSTNTASYGALYASLTDGSVLHLTTSSTLPLVLQTNGGEVGIGVTNPSTRLALAGTGSVNGITLGDDAADSVNLYRSASNTLKTDDDFVVGGGLTVIGLTTSQGSVDLGDNITDTITFVGVVDSHISPEASSQYNLGTASKRWATGYFDTVDATSLSGTVTGGSTTSPTWTINSDNPSSNAEISALAFETGSGVFNSTLQWNASGDTGSKIAGFDDTILANYPLAIYSEVSGGNQTFTSGTLFKYSQPSSHAITQSGAFTGINLDFSSNITNATNDQTGIAITLRDGSSSGTATGISIGGTTDYALVTSSTAGNVGIGTTTPSSLLSLGSDAGTAASGITFGVTADTNLYRSAANTLKTDDSLVVATTLDVDGYFALGSNDPVQHVTFYLDRTFTNTSSSHPKQLLVQGKITQSTTAGVPVNYVDINPQVTITGVASPSVYSLKIGEPNITLASGGTVMNASTLYVADAPTEATSNYALFVDSGATRLDGQLQLDLADGGTSATGVVFGSSQDTNLYRSAPNELKTDDNLTVALDVTSGGTFRLNPASDRPLIVNQFDAFTSGANVGFGRWGLYQNSFTLVVGVPGTDYGAGTSSIKFSGWLEDSTRQDWVTIEEGGNVGVGTTSPVALLDVNNTTTKAITADASARVLNIQGAFTEAASGNHARIAGLEITPPTITDGTATVTNTASLYVSDAPTATVTGANYALWVDAGASRFDGDIIVNQKIYNNITSGNTILSGGSASDSGANIALFGGSHATTPNRIQVRRGTTSALLWDANTFAFQEATAISTTTGNLTLSPTADLTVTSNADVEGYAAIGNGSAINQNQTLIVNRTFTAQAANVPRSLYVQGALTAAAGFNASLVEIDGTLVEAGSGTHNIFSGLRVNAFTLSDGLADTTNASTVYISDAPSGASSNYALWVDAGATQLDGTLRVDGGVGIGAAAGSTGSALTIAQTDSTSQSAVTVRHTTSGTVASSYAFDIQELTSASAITVTDAIGILVRSPSVGGGSSITNYYGIQVPTSGGSTQSNGIAITAGTGSGASLWLSYTTDATTSVGGILFGSSKDTNLYRSAASTLVTDSSFRVGNTASNTASLLLDSKAAATTGVLRTSVQGDVGARLTLDADGKISWGDGTAAVDTNLYRGAANRLDLASGDSLYIVDGTLAVGSAPDTTVGVQIQRTVSTTTGFNQLWINGALTVTGGTSSQYNAYFANSGGITINSGNTHDIVGNVLISEPNITETSGSVTNAVSLYIASAPTEGNNNYALWVDAGATQLDGSLAVGGTSTLTGNVGIGTAANASQSLIIGSSLSGSGSLRALMLIPTLTATSGTSGLYAAQLTNWTIDVQSGGTHSLAAGLVLSAPTLTETSGSVTDFATLYIGGTTSAADNNYSVWVDAGTTRLDGQLQLDLADGGTSATGIVFGSTQDANLYRAGADRLATDDRFDVVRTTAASDVSFSTRASADANSRWFMYADGAMWWGPGSAGQDANLYRSAADVLKTDDSFVAATKSAIGQSAISANNVFKIAGSTDTAGSGGSILGVYGGTVTATANSDNIETIYATTTIAKAGFTGLKAYGLWIDTMAESGTGTISNAYGLNVAAQTIGTANYGVKIDATSTQTLWVGAAADSTTAAAGIAFGLSRDTNLYRSAANVLRTDDSFTTQGNIFGTATATATSTTVDATDTGSGTTLVVADTTGIDAGNLILVNGATWTRVTANGGGAPGNLTIEPAISRSSAQSVAEYTTPVIGSTNIQERFDKGYFMNGVVTGSASTTYADNSITFGGGTSITDSSGKLTLRAGGATAGENGDASIYFADSSGNTRGRLDTANLSGVTDDGALSVTTGTTTLNQTATTQNSGNNSTGSTIYAVSTSGFSANDAVLIMQMKGGTPGNYEVVIVTEVVSGTQLSVTPALSNTYTQTTNSRCNASDANCAQIVRVPRHTTITCTGGTITAPAWSTTTGVGGILWAQATGDVSISDACVVDMNGKGYTGGAATSGGSGGTGGSGFPGSVGNVGTTGNGPGAGGAGGTAGGGGLWGGGGAAGSSGGGGGAGYSEAGTAGTAGVSATGPANGSGGAGGAAGGAGTAGSAGSSISPTFTSRIIMGSGGGSGGSGAGGGGSNTNGGAGGAGGAGGTGGGIVVFHSATSITNSATIQVSGNTGSNGSNGTPGTNDTVAAGGGGAPGAGGGGGAGGSIWLNAPTVTAGSLTASAGSGGARGTGGKGGDASTGGFTGGTGTGGAGGGGATNGGNGGTGGAGPAGAGGAGAAGKTDSSTNSTLPGSSYGTFFVASTNTSSADVAELYLTNDESIVPGDIVVWSKNEEGVKGLMKASTAYSSTMVGAVSTSPGVLLGNHDGAKNEDKRAVALSGRIPVKVSAINGPIEAGDGITSSPIPGFGMKATQPGRIIGYAMAEFAPESPEQTGIIQVFVSLELFIPPYSSEFDFDAVMETTSPTSTVSGTTADALTSDFFKRLVEWFQGVTLKVMTLVADLIQTKTIQTEFAQYKDRATGSIYCVWIENGEFLKAEGVCGESSSEGQIIQQTGVSGSGSSEQELFEQPTSSVQEEAEIPLVIETTTPTTQDAVEEQQEITVPAESVVEETPTEGAVVEEVEQEPVVEESSAPLEETAPGEAEAPATDG